MDDCNKNKILSFLNSYSKDFDALEFIQEETSNLINKKELVIKSKEINKMLSTDKFEIIKLEKNEFELKKSKKNVITDVEIINTENNSICSISYLYDGEKYLYLDSLYVNVNDIDIFLVSYFPAIPSATTIKEKKNKIEKNIFASADDLCEIINYFVCE